MQIPPLVDTQTWEQVQRQLKTNSLIDHGNAMRFYLLRGLMVCGKCGQRYVGERAGKRVYYRCAGTRARGHKHKRCASPKVQAEPAEHQIWEVCKALILEPRPLLEQIREERLSRQTEVPALDVVQYETQIRELQAQQDRLLRIAYQQDLPEVEYADHLAELRQQRYVLQSALEAYHATEQRDTAQEAQYASMTEVLEGLQAGLAAIEASDDPHARRQVVELVISQIRVVARTDGRPPYRLEVSYAF